jgi:hypothetical protein
VGKDNDLEARSFSLLKVFVPLHLNALEREPKFKNWLQEVAAGLDAEVLFPEGWFSAGHGGALIFGCLLQPQVKLLLNN